MNGRGIGGGEGGRVWDTFPSPNTEIIAKLVILQCIVMTHVKVGVMRRRRGRGGEEEEEGEEEERERERRRRGRGRGGGEEEEEEHR